jgi:cell division protein FtsQ
VLAGLVAWGTPALLREAAFFRVRRVELLGARYLTGPEAAAALELAEGASLFDPLAGMAERIAAIPGIRSARIGRRWPGTLVVRVVEAEPVALAPNQGVLTLVDEGGQVLPFDPTRAPLDLPVAEADSLVTHVLARVRDLEPALFAEIRGARRERRDVVLEGAGTRYLLRGTAGPDAIRAVAAVARDLASRGRGFRELDGRFADRVFVRGMQL